MSFRFPAGERAKLTNEERQREQPADGIVERMSPSRTEHCVDLGCGTGYVTLPLARRVRHVVGVDAEQVMLDDLLTNAKNAGLDNVSVQLSELPDVALEAGLFDRAVMVSVAHEIADRTKMSSEIARILKPEGHFTLVDFQKRQTSFGPPVEERMPENEALTAFPDFRVARKWSFPIFYQIEFVRKDHA